MIGLLLKSGAAVEKRDGAGETPLMSAVRSGDAAAVSELLTDPQALAASRAGAERARAELTWNAAAAQHLTLYRELT